MSHLCAVNVACTHGLDGCRPTRGTLAAGCGTAIGLRHVNDDQSEQRDESRRVCLAAKPLVLNDAQFRPKEVRDSTDSHAASEVTV